MNMLEAFRGQMNAFRKGVDEYAYSQKCSQAVLEALELYYENLTVEEKSLASYVIEEWLLSENESERFDALFLIERFKLRDLAASMHLLEDRLVGSRFPGAPFELDRLRAITGDLGVSRLK